MKKISLFAVATFTMFTTLAQQPVSIPGSESRTIRSAIVGQDYVLQIRLPASYAAGAKQYPVVYLMDSQWDFPLLTSLYGEQYYDGFIPELIIVGVTWGGANPNPDSLRARDYTPTREDRLPQSGGAATFLSFMKNELFPYVESHYRADKNDRALMGCSLGGLFTLFALFTEPGLFQRYVAASPAFGWDREAIYRYEEAYFKSKPAAPARLCMIMGGVERGVPGFEKLVRHLTGRQYTSLQFSAKVLENTGHSGTKGEGYARGLQYIYQRPSLQLADAMLDEYSGSYGTGVTIRRNGSQLVIDLGKNNSYTLYAAGDADFYANSEFLNLHFTRSNGKVNGFSLERYGNTQFINKNP
ncbi:MAG: alpha/beta hydrolase-fold protein [Chitinophagaceae bacterium]